MSVLHKNVCCGYSLESPQHMCLWRNKQKYSLIITECPPYLFHCSGLNFTQVVFDARNSEQGLGSVFVSSRGRARFLVCFFFFAFLIAIKLKLKK